MSDHEKDSSENSNEEGEHNTTGTPNGPSQDADSVSGGSPDDADTASGGAPDESGD